MKKRFNYAEESDDLKLARQKEAEAHRAFLEDMDRFIRFNSPTNCMWSEFYDTPEEVAA